jgi:ribulose-phosphate 3-epimerase
MLQDALIGPSIFAADQMALGAELQAVSQADFIHFDVMDGVFVPNLSFGPLMLASMRAATELPIDVHLMISEPDRRFRPYVEAGADYVTFHYEAQLHAHRTLYAIREMGAKAGIAISPGTPVNVLESLIDDVDLVLVMSVNPGYSGQAFIPRAFDKVRQVARLSAEHGVRPLIEVDGGVGVGNIGKLADCGANMFVAGSAVFAADDPGRAIAELRHAASLGQVHEG